MRKDYKASERDLGCTTLRKTCIAIFCFSAIYIWIKKKIHQIQLNNSIWK